MTDIHALTADIDYQKVVNDLDRQNLDVMEEKIEELLELINTLSSRIDKLEKTVVFLSGKR
jgi:predicted translin family RNA/ssDNA-binding protein